MNVYFKWSWTAIKLFLLQGDCNSDITCKALQMEEEITHRYASCRTNKYQVQLYCKCAQAPPIPCR